MWVLISVLLLVSVLISTLVPMMVLIVRLICICRWVLIVTVMTVLHGYAGYDVDVEYVVGN